MDDTQRLAAEALAAVTGIPRLLDKKPKPVTQADARRAIKLAPEIEALFRDFLEGNAFKRQKDDVPSLDYLETMDKLTRPVDVSQREALIGQFDNHEAGLMYLDVLDKGVAWLLEQLPRQSRSTLVGDIPVEPAQSDMAVFEWQWQIASDPRQALKDMGEGILITVQVDAFRALFPTLYQRSVMALQGAIIDARTKDDTWEPPVEKQWQAYTFFGLSPVDPDLATKLQAQSRAAVAAGDQQADSGGQPIQIDEKGFDQSTANQRLANE